MFPIRWPLQAQQVDRNHPTLAAIPSPSPLPAENLLQAAREENAALLQRLNTTPDGLSALQSELRLKRAGPNLIAHEKPVSWIVQLLNTFKNPLVILLASLAALSLLSGDSKAALIILSMISFSVILRFSQEYKSMRAAQALRQLVHTTATVKRRDLNKDISPGLAADLGLRLDQGSPQEQEVPIDRLVPGDIILLAAGDMIPGDIRILASKDLFVSQGALTGESMPVEKHPKLPTSQLSCQQPLELDNLCFMGTSVVSGTATVLVIETGAQTYLGSLAKEVTGQRSRTSFERGINDVSMLLLRFMAVMAPAVFLINWVSKGNWGEAFFFALSVAVGLTPEMLPMIVTANLSRGAISMSKMKVIVKNIDSIQNLGAMNILCTDKTGTLTQDRIILEMHLDYLGKDNAEAAAPPRARPRSSLGPLLDRHRDVTQLARIEHQRGSGTITVGERANSTAAPAVSLRWVATAGGAEALRVSGWPRCASGAVLAERVQRRSSLIVRACTSTAPNSRPIPRDSWMIPRTRPSICSTRGLITVRICRA
jgi:Mg2+-importing ATPase